MKQTYKLMRPITFEGNEITEIEYDFDVVSGGDIISLKSSFARCKGKDIEILGFTPFLDPEFQALIFAKAAEKPIELMHKLGAPDFVELTLRVQAFLQNPDSD